MCTEIRNCDCLWTDSFSHIFLHPIQPSSQAVVTAFAFGVGATGYTDLFVIWYKLDQMTRTFCNAFTAGLTCFLIYDLQCHLLHE